MNIENPNIDTSETLARLKMANISVYKIAREINEPKSTIANILSGHCKYSEDKIESILEKINIYLDEFEFEIDPKMMIKLFSLGLDSKNFSPEEKYQLAIAYKKLKDSKQTK